MSEKLSESRRGMLPQGTRKQTNANSINPDPGNLGKCWLGTGQRPFAVSGVCVARAPGFVSSEDEEADAALADQQSDVYPRASLADWEPALKGAMHIRGSFQFLIS